MEQQQLEHLLLLYMIMFRAMMIRGEKGHTIFKDKYVNVWLLIISLRA